MKVLTKDGLSYFWTKIKAFLNTKQDTISDLDTIRSGAQLGSTALQSFTETDPTVPAHVKSITQQNITNWNNKLDSFTETDPVFNASVAAEITSTDISNWNSKTDNVGTITGINMNGASKGTSGVVDLGTVITSETQLSKGTTSGSGNAVTDITVSNHQITLTKGKTFLESFTETDPIFTASPAADITSSDIEYWNAKQNKIIPPEVGSLYRTDVSGSGGISIRGTKGQFPTVNYADTYTLITTMQSSTQSYGINVNFGGNAYTLNTTNGRIEDTRQLTVNAGATWSASVVGNVSANTAISVKILGSLDYITTVGMAAITNKYADLDGKPSIPTVYNGKLTIQRNGTNVQTFTANQSSNVTANIVVPTKVSDLTNDSGFINSFTETDPVFSASSAASITSSDISNWNSKTDNVGTITGITMNGVSKGTSGVVDLGTVITEHQSLASYAKTANYDSTTHKIYLKNGNTVLSEIDASDFIKDGMVSTVTIGNGTGANASINCLIVSFNTDSGKDNIEIPISNIFNASNYYTKTEIDNAGYLTSETDPTVPSWAKQSSKPSYNYSEIANTPNLANVAISGSYNDLSDKPTIPAAQVNADWNASSGVAKILNKPTIPSSTSQLTNDSGYLTSYTETDPTVPAWAKAANKPTYTASEVGALPSTTYIPTKTSDLTNDSGYLTSYTETDPTVPSWAKQSTKPSYSYSEISNTPTLATVATSGSYNDLSNKPTIPSAPGTLNTNNTTAQTVSSSEALSGTITLHKVSKTGSYNDLTNKPTIPTVNNATLTIQKNGTNIATFTANASTGTTANITVPTATSDLTNDSGFLGDADVSYDVNTKTLIIGSSVNKYTITLTIVGGAIVSDISVDGESKYIRDFPLEGSTMSFTSYDSNVVSIIMGGNHIEHNTNYVISTQESRSINWIISNIIDDVVVMVGSQTNGEN